MLENPGLSLEEESLFSSILPTRNLPLEIRLLRALDWNDFPSLDLPPCTYPKMLRGLSGRASSSREDVANNFSQFLPLKKLLHEKAKLYLYHAVLVERPLRFGVMAQLKSEGDLLSLEDLVQLLERALPFSEKELFFSRPNEAQADSHQEMLFSSRQRCAMARVDFLLQYPHYFPATDALLKSLYAQGFRGQHALVGRNGALQERSFPLWGCSLGLHFLEKGIVAHDRPKTKLTDWLHLPVARMLLGPGFCSLDEVELYKKRVSLNYLDARSKNVFLQAFAYILATSSLRKVDICAPASLYQAELLQEVCDLALEKRCKMLQIYYKGRHSLHTFFDQGKTARLFFLDPLLEKERWLLFDATRDLLVVQNTWGFSQALFLRVPYFYEVHPFDRYFLQDLLALGEYYFSHLPDLTGYLRHFAVSLPQQERVPRGNSSMQEERIFPEEGFGTKTIEALHSFNRTLLRYFSANLLLVGLVKRALLQQRAPRVYLAEKKWENLYLQGKISFVRFIQEIQKEIAPYTIEQRRS
ncbi:MAG: hypothetical protein AAGF04_00250 [Chlamydiota bacterium]